MNRMFSYFAFFFYLLSIAVCANDDSGYYSLDPAENKPLSTLVVIREAGMRDIDLYVDDRRIVDLQAHSINYVLVSPGFHNVILDIKSGSQGYFIKVFNFNQDDTLPICLKPVPSPITDSIEIRLAPVDKNDLLGKQSSGYFKETRSSYFSTQHRMPGNIYSQLQQGQNEGKSIVGKNALDSYGISLNCELSSCIGPQDALTVSRGINIELETYCMFTYHWGTGFRIGYTGDNFEMDESTDFSQSSTTVELWEMEYSWFLKIVLARQGSTSLFLEPGLGCISGLSKERTTIGDSYSSGYFGSSADIQKVCFIVHAGIGFGIFEIRSGYYTGVESPASKWFTVNLGFNFASKSKSACDQ